jgi:hypothetical protein
MNEVGEVVMNYIKVRNLPVKVEENHEKPPGFRLMSSDSLYYQTFCKVKLHCEWELQQVIITTTTINTVVPPVA